MHTFTFIFLFFLTASVLARFWLNHRQVQHIRSHYDKVPPAFADKIQLVDHQRAADYNCTKLQFGRVLIAWEAIWLLLWTLAGGVDLIDRWWRDFEYSPLTTGLCVILSWLAFSACLNLPFSLYNTFVIEERYGFNKTTWMTWFTDLFKSTVLMLVIGVPLIAALLWLMNQAGEHWWAYAWLLWLSFSLVMIWAYPTFIAPLFNQFTSLPNDSLRDRIENLLKDCGFHAEGVFVVDGSRRSSHGNAYFTGFGKNKRIVFYDTLLESLNEDEVEAVLAHELGHFKRHHIRKSLLVSGIMSLAGFAILAWLMESGWFYAALGVNTLSVHTALILFLLAMPVFTYFISPVFAALSRKHEFEADEFAHQNSNYKALISALVNLYRDNASTLTPDPIHSGFYDSHPPASIRIDHLKAVAMKGSA